MNKVKRNKWLYVSAVLYGLAALVDTVFAFLLGNIINGATSKNIEILINNIIYAVVLMVISLIIYWYANKSRRNYVMYNVMGIKEKLMDSFYKRGISKYNDNDDSYYINLITNDLDLLELNYFLQKPLIFFYISSFVFASIALIFISWKAMVAFVLMFFLPLLIPQCLNKKLVSRKEKVSKGNEDFIFEIKEQIQGMEDIIINLSINNFFEKFKMCNLRQQVYKKESGTIEGFIKSLSSICGFIAQIGCMGIGGVLVVKGEINVGEMIAAIQLLNSIFNPINVLSEIIALMKSTEPIRDKINMELDIQECKQNSEILKNNFDIVYDNLSVSFDEKNVIVNKFNHLFTDGNISGVIGKSGCGKTTIFRCLLGMYNEYSGRITVGGHDIKNISNNEIYRFIGYVPQYVYIFNDTIINNITLGINYNKKEVEDVIERVKLKDLISMQKGKIGDNGRSISGGEKQRIGLARVLLRKPKIIIFDEPTSALDPITRDMINKLIFDLEGYTRIIVTHDRRPEFLNLFDEVIEL